MVDWLEVPVEIKEVFWGERKKNVNWGMQEYWGVGILYPQFCKMQMNLKKEKQIMALALMN